MAKTKKKVKAVPKRVKKVRPAEKTVKAPRRAIDLAMVEAGRLVAAKNTPPQVVATPVRSIYADVAIAYAKAAVRQADVMAHRYTFLDDCIGGCLAARPELPWAARQQLARVMARV